MILELTREEIGWVKYALMRSSATLNGRDKEMTLKEERLLERIVKKIEKQEIKQKNTQTIKNRTLQRI